MTVDYAQLALKIKQLGQTFGFGKVGISDTQLQAHQLQYQQWLAQGFNGEMDYMANNQALRFNPDQLHPGTLSIISVTMDYLPPDAGFAKNLKQPDTAYISRYALGRDYHKLMRNRLKQFGEAINALVEQDCGFRPFVDSAPVLERQIAEKAGLGWIGKHSLVLNQEGGSWFFLGELLLGLPLPADTPVNEQCGQCVACMTICPTGAIVEPYVVDARKCISYLTIELKGAIPEPYRRLIGNRIYGCDDCQLICPWNRYGQLTKEADFNARPWLKHQPLIALWQWDEPTFLKNTEGSAIRRIGYERWLRNIAVALGNAPASEAIVAVLQQKLGVSPLVDEHIEWAIAEQQNKLAPSQQSRLNAKHHTEPLAQHPESHTAQRKTLRLVRAIEKGLVRDA